MKKDDLGLAPAVRDKARELGFDLIGFGAAAPFDAERELFLERLSAGYLQGMAWITPERARLSCDPETLLPGARTIVALGTSYAPRDAAGDKQVGGKPPNPRAPRDETKLDEAGDKQVGGKPPIPRPQRYETKPPDEAGSGSETTAGVGRVARYAQGKDYHDVIPPKLKTLAAFIAQLGGGETRCRSFVDTGPLVDRAAARRSGLGFYGKNTCLLTGPHGSYVFLSAILTTVEIPSDPLVTKDCGSCRACIDACPTDALVNPGELDATRCISYLTIEHRGSIPRELRSGLGNWVFGCDVCQDVCPWNRARPRGVHGEFSAAQGVGAELDLEGLLSLDDKQFGQRFRGTPLTRAKRRGLLRNAAVVLGNLADPAAERALIGGLGDPEPLVREHAAWALGRIEGLSGGARVALAEALKVEGDEAVRAELEQVLAGL